MGSDKRKFVITIFFVVFLNAVFICITIFLFLRVDLEKESIQSLKERAGAYEERTKNTRDVERALANKEKEVVEVESIFLDKESIINFIEELENLAAQSNLQIEIKNVEGVTGGTEKPKFIVNTAGSFSDIYHFIVFLENGNYQAEKKINFARKAFEMVGIGSERILLDWVSAGEGERFAQVVRQFIEKIRQLIHAVAPAGQLNEQLGAEAFQDFPQQPGGKGAVISWFRGSKELDYKYTLTNIWCKMKLAYGPRPRPGSDPKTPTMAMYGTASFLFDAFIYTDYRSIWCKSAVLRLVRPFREKYLYYDKLELFAQDVRNDVSTIIKKLKDYCSYLPALA